MASTHSHPVKESGMRSVSEPRARQKINTLTHYYGIRDALGIRNASSQQGYGSTEDQHTHMLSGDQGRIRDAFVQRGSSSIEGQYTHQLSRDQNAFGIRDTYGQRALSTTEDNTLTLCQWIGTACGIRAAFGRRGSNSTKDQQTHELSKDQGHGSKSNRSARLELDRGSTHSHPVKGSGTRLDQDRVWYPGRVRSARLELHRGSIHSPTVKESGMRSGSGTCSVEPYLISGAQLDKGSTHSHPVTGSGTHSGSGPCLVSKPRARQRINTLTLCQGFRDTFGRRGWSTIEDQHTYQLLRDHDRIGSASLHLDRESTHSPTVEGSRMHSGIRAAFHQKGSNTTKDQTLTLCSRDQEHVRSGSLEFDRGSTHSLSVKGPGPCLGSGISEHRMRQRINTLTSCKGIKTAFGIPSAFGIGNAFIQRGSSSAGDPKTHILSRDRGRDQSARLELDRASTHSRPVKRSARLELEGGLTHSRSVKGSPISSDSVRDQDHVRSGCLELDRGSTHSRSVKESGPHSVSGMRSECVQSERVELDTGSTHSHSVKGSRTSLVRIGTTFRVKDKFGIRDAFRKRSESIRSERLELDKGSTDPPTVK
ncbi:hypothetical protein BDR03DRAFT_1010308 [Suillus americanus]|nr:hypothetical protein BDR03DRAFT_1010308 [Suillus americanus]